MVLLGIASGGVCLKPLHLASSSRMVDTLLKKIKFFTIFFLILTLSIKYSEWWYHWKTEKNLFFEKDYRDNKIVGLVDRWSLFRGSHAEVVTRSA